MADTSALENNRRKTNKAGIPFSYPLTHVPFFKAKHRALKKAKANAAAKGLPLPKSTASLIDMAVVRDFDHYDDIGKLPNDPVVKDLTRRKALEIAAEVRREDAIAKACAERDSRAARQENCVVPPKPVLRKNITALGWRPLG